MCFSLGPFSSGCSTDTTYTANLNASISAVSSVLQSISNSSQTTITLDQNASIVFGDGDIIGCSIDITQVQGATVNIVTQLNTDQNTSLVTALQDSVSSQLNQLTSAQSGVLAGALNASSSANVNQAVNNFIQSSLTAETVNGIILNTNQSQNGHLVFGNNCTITGPVCTIDQNIVLNMIATNIIGALQTAALSNTDMQALTAAASQSTSTVAKGLDAIVEDVVNAIASVFNSVIIAYILIVIVIACVILGIGFMIVKLVRGAKTSTATTDKASPQSDQSFQSIPQPV